MSINETIVRSKFGTGYKPRPPESRVTLRSDHERAARNVAENSARIADVARQILHKLHEARATGDRLSVQAQMNFLTSLYMRLVKDVAIVDHLQMKGAKFPKRDENGALE